MKGQDLIEYVKDKKFNFNLKVGSILVITGFCFRIGLCIYEKHMSLVGCQEDLKDAIYNSNELNRILNECNQNKTDAIFHLSLYDEVEYINLGANIITSLIDRQDADLIIECVKECSNKQ